MVRLVLSFDDGRWDAYRVHKDILKPLGMPFTLNITTGYIDSTIAESDKPCGVQPLSEKEVMELAQSPLVEIAGHGHRHDNDIQNLLTGIEEIRNRYMHEPDMSLGMASPSSAFDRGNMVQAVEVFKKNGILYMALGDRKQVFTFFRRCVRRINRMIHVPWLYYWINKVSVLDREDTFWLYRVPVLRDNRLKEVRYFIERLMESGDSVSCILMFHSILKRGEAFYEDLFSWDYDDFKNLCEWLSKLSDRGELNVCLTREMVK
ncbi:MAG: polysaccharide deacetylase family protein [Lachnospiraceae bacterium]|nr:polysaccharide deacetylase family protein [Lachnospiraceae bacterium]MCM1238781.1 polysaccharide deacetylase family protein [Lachnospiraceae bacterium]